VNRTILVTGAAGFAGSHLLDLLDRDDGSVVAWRRPGERLPANRSEDTGRWMSLDLLDRDVVRAAIAEVGPDEMYHFAGAAHVGASWSRIADTLAVNVLGTHHLLEALDDAGIRARVLIPGSALVYRPSETAMSEDDAIAPGSPYALSKLAQEMAGSRAARDRGMAVVLTRSFNHVGPRQDPSYFASSFARQIALVEAGRAEPVLEVGNLAARRDLTDVRDTVRAYRLLMARGRPGVPYNVCSGHAYRVGDVLDELLRASRVPIAVRVDPARYRRNDHPVVLGNPSRIRNELGWRPEVSLTQTLRDLLDFWRLSIARER
jgi:GDP-4-dehydro-6-deoxy-D-mannose reductase